MTTENPTGVPIHLKILGPGAVIPDSRVVIQALIPPSRGIQDDRYYKVRWTVAPGRLALASGPDALTSVSGPVIETRPAVTDYSPALTDELVAGKHVQRVLGVQLHSGVFVLFDAKGVRPGERIEAEVRLSTDDPTEILGQTKALFDVLDDSLEPLPTPVERTPIDAALSRTALPEQEAIQTLCAAITLSTESLSFPNFVAFVDNLFCPRGQNGGPSLDAIAARRALPFPGVDPYRLLKAAAEAFLMVQCCRFNTEAPWTDRDQKLERIHQGGAALTVTPDLNKAWKDLLAPTVGQNGFHPMLPYLALIHGKIPEVNVAQYLQQQGVCCGEGKLDAALALCTQEIQMRGPVPCFIELIWSYWHEEAMHVQTMNAISTRFQNRRMGNGRDPLANLEIDFLRPLGNLLWGYIQDEQHRLSVVRRAYEYEHHYGLSLHGRAVTDLKPADRRSKFLEAFHNLLYRCTEFFRQDDDKTIDADAFPVLNSIKETHYVLAQGAHNQFGDLPATARQEMLIEQWLLARPEMREFLGGRLSVPYPEDWMDRVDTMKTLQSWNDVSVVHFHDLAVFGEQIVLAIRYHTWSLESDPKTAVAWARHLRSRIQGYIHAYRVVTGIDLTADITDTQQLSQRYLPPSVHLRKRLVAQKAT